MVIVEPRLHSLTAYKGSVVSIAIVMFPGRNLIASC